MESVMIASPFVFGAELGARLQTIGRVEKVVDNDRGVMLSGSDFVRLLHSRPRSGIGAWMCSVADESSTGRSCGLASGSAVNAVQTTSDEPDVAA